MHPHDFAAELLVCDLCDGVGDVDCLQCGGSGATDAIAGPAETCPTCSGAGLTCCPECEGSGAVAAEPLAV
jgi:hypothetical protein